jgi:HJR/Mrr/RecB family endonuclease
MSYLKFGGVLEEIIKQYPNIDVVGYLEQKLGIPQYKAEELAGRIAKEYFQKSNEKTKQNSAKTILEKSNKPEISPRASVYSVEILSETEFERFIKWLFEELGYKIGQENYSTELGVDLVAMKDGEKIIIQARRYPKSCKVSNMIVLLSQEAKRTYECKRSIVVATTFFTEEAKADAQKFGVELWDSDTLDGKISEVRKKAEVEVQPCFPEYKESLFQSLLSLEDTKVFLIEPRADTKYDLYLPGVKFPLLTFQVRLGEIIRCVYRIRNNEPVGEFEGAELIRSERNNGKFGPDDMRAYALIVQYLEQFLK